MKANANSRINRRDVLCAIVGTCLPLLAGSEPCELVGGCAGNVWYVHVPKSQFTKSVVFEEVGLPPVNRVLKTRAGVSLLAGDTFSKKPYPRQLAQELAELTGPTKTVLMGWGSTLGAGSRVRVLSYRTFPELGAAAQELFVLVLVVTE